MGDHYSESGDANPPKICSLERQNFIDCMFVHSKCVQSGRESFDGCLEQELSSGAIYPDCLILYRTFLKCRTQMVCCFGVSFISLIVGHSH